VAALVLLDTTTTTSVTLSSDLLALLGLAVLALPAWLVLRARDPRRFVLGVTGAALLWLLLFYPNLSGLPMPTDLATLYQGLLPTWNWDFQFAVNMDPATGGGLVDAVTLVVAAVSVVAVVGVALVARRWGRATGTQHEPPWVGPPTPPPASSAPGMPSAPWGSTVSSRR
jgi:hypothetical protein